MEKLSIRCGCHLKTIDAPKERSRLLGKKRLFDHHLHLSMGFYLFLINEKSFLFSTLSFIVVYIFFFLETHFGFP